MARVLGVALAALALAAGADARRAPLPGVVTPSGNIRCFYVPVGHLLCDRRLAYGATWRFGAFTCISRRAGVTCTSRFGHGLFLSRESWRGW